MSIEGAKARSQFVIERTFSAPLDDVWAFWTSKGGIEAWWGPEGFSVEVTSLDLRNGGAMVYEMTAVGADQAAYMRNAGLPLTTTCRVAFTDVSPRHRLAFKTLADFIPGVAPYEVETAVTFSEVAEGVKVVIAFDTMHDDIWTERARSGHESQLRKLDALMAARGQSRREG